MIKIFYMILWISIAKLREKWRHVVALFTWICGEQRTAKYFELSWKVVVPRASIEKGLFSSIEVKEEDKEMKEEKGKRSFDSFLALVFAWLIPNVGLRWLFSVKGVFLPFTFGWGTHFLRWSSLTDTYSLRWRSLDSLWRWSSLTDFIDQSWVNINPVHPSVWLVSYVGPRSPHQGGIPTRDLWPHVNLVDHSATQCSHPSWAFRNI